MPLAWESTKYTVESVKLEGERQPKYNTRKLHVQTHNVHVHVGTYMYTGTHMYMYMYMYMYTA